VPVKAIREIVAHSAFQLFRELLFSDLALFPAEHATFLTYPAGRAVDLGAQKGHSPVFLSGGNRCCYRAAEKRRRREMTE